MAVGGTTTFDVPSNLQNMSLVLEMISANDIQHLYDSANKLASIRMTNHDMISFMNEAQSTVKELRMFLEVDSLNEMKKKLDKYYMVMILRVIHLDFNHIRDQLLTSHEVPSMDTLITCMVRVPTPETFAVVEPSVMVATRGRAGHGTRGSGRGRPQCTYCKRMGHTQENCYSLHGFPSKTVNVSQAETTESKFTKDEYQEYL